MTEVIRLEINYFELLKQPFQRRYALFCGEVLDRNLVPSKVDCPSMSRGGHLRDFEDYQDARDDATLHPHRAVIKFFPAPHMENPSQQFLKDLEHQAKQPGQR